MLGDEITIDVSKKIIKLYYPKTSIRTTIELSDSNLLSILRTKGVETRLVEPSNVVDSLLTNGCITWQEADTFDKILKEG